MDVASSSESGPAHETESKDRYLSTEVVETCRWVYPVGVAMCTCATTSECQTGELAGESPVGGLGTGPEHLKNTGNLTRN